MELSLHSEAKILVFDCVAMFCKALEYVKNSEETFDHSKILSVIDTQCKEDIFDFVQAIIIPEEEVALKEFVVTVERRKKILQRNFESDNILDVIDTLFSFEDYFSEDLIKRGFMLKT